MHLKTSLQEQTNIRDDESFPNIIPAEVYGQNAEETLDKMLHLLDLLDHGYHFDSEDNFISKYPHYVDPDYISDFSDIVKDGMCLYEIDEDISAIALAPQKYPPSNAERFIEGFAEYCQMLYSHSGINVKNNFQRHCIDEIGDEIRYSLYEDDYVENGLFWQDWMKSHAPQREEIEQWYNEHGKKDLIVLSDLPYSILDIPLILWEGYCK